MPFVKGFDPKRNYKGPPTLEEREAKERDKALPKSRLRKVRTSLDKHVADAILEAATIMKTALKEETKLKAAVFIVDQFIKVNNTIIEEERKAAQDLGLEPKSDEELLKEEESLGAVFSLNLVSSKDEEQED